MRIGLLAMLLCWVGWVQAAPVTVRDDAGNTITLQKAAQRVISLAPSLTELLYEAGGGKTLVGTVDYSDYPPQALKVPRIGSNQTLDLERIAALKPDLILVWFHGNAQREIDRLHALKIPMFYVEPHHIEEIADALERIGNLVGSENVAHAAADRFRTRYAQLHMTYAQRQPVRVFYQISDQPLLTINDQQIISAAIHLCGGINVFGKESMLVPQLSVESVVTANPDVILTARIGGSADNANAAQRKPDEPSLRRWLAFHDMNAVKRGQLWLIPGDQISRHGPRILDGTQAICTALDAARQAK
jgi:iron complex transport system substrate-binding protein